MDDRVVVLGVAESDAHAVANRLIEFQLRELGFAVVNLGVCTPLADFADAVAAHPQARAVVIGSVNGHAVADLRDLPALRGAGRLPCPVVVGGNLTIDPADRPEAKRQLLALGVDHVLDDLTELAPLLLAPPDGAQVPDEVVRA
ncbi:cobalamin-dependent protein [Goodfellowiella coeruleoviolacea]|uniref:cobalamin-dependent protein n=1 Tax=Goodfellowiella coeruleoviolacea TaxID=334858 RepID=UPI0020A25EB0|nr:cobalamin-dependent protein [Goodfellowiella coeruleoviolacea]